MGCDIHAFIEYRDGPTEPWKSFGGRTPLPRCYAAFGVIAGVRGEPIAETPLPRGIPSDAGPEAFHHYWQFVGEGADGKPVYQRDGDAHSASWLTLDEFNTLVKAVPDAPWQYADVGSCARVFKAQGREVRIVFWFDN